MHSVMLFAFGLIAGATLAPLALLLCQGAAEHDAC